MDVPNLVFDTPLWLALLATGVAATEGAVVGRGSTKPRYDVVGVFVLAAVLGLAGGITRDVLIGNLPVMAIRTPWYIVTVLCVTIVVVLIGHLVPPITGMWFQVLDALTLGLYTAIATGYALQAGASVAGALFVGVTAGAIGGVLVALLRGTTPAVLVPGVLYVLIALVGSVAYVVIEPHSPGFAALACVGLVVVMRYFSVRFDLRTRAVVGPPRPDPEP